MIEDPTNPDHLAIGATYGILTTSDRGRNWYHVCEGSFANLATYTGDPLLDFASDGALLVGVQQTLNASRDACQWQAKLGGGSTYVIDYTVVRSAPGTVVALVVTYEMGTTDYAVWKSTDGAENWSRLGAVPAESAYTLDVDAADTDHLYVTAVNGNVGQLLRSNDAGVTWTVRDIPGTSIDEAPYLAALHPSDPRRIYVRTDSWVPLEGDLTANDALLYSNDGGETWTEVFRNRAKLLGFALSPDASTLLLGYGDPFAGGTTSVPGRLGIFKSPTDAFAFEPIFSAHVGCLAWTARGLYVCASQHFDRFELGFSPRADFSLDAGCIEPLLQTPDVKGPLACPADTAGVVCGANWVAACAALGACTDAGAAPWSCDGRDASTESDSGADGGAIDGAADIASEPPLFVAPDTSGCSCRAVTARRHVTMHHAAWLVALLMIARRRRDRARGVR